MLALGLWAPTAASPSEAVSRLLAMQAQEHRYALWSIAQRMGDRVGRSELDAAFDDGAFLRTHVLRPTWHYVAPSDLGWLIRLSGPRVIARLRRRTTDLGLDERTLSRATAAIAVAVAGEPLTRKELVDELRRRRISTDGQRIAHMLMRAELEGAVCSGPMKGAQHTYMPFDRRVPSGVGPEGDEALGELVRRYLETRGSATVKDLVWWSGLSTADVRRGIEVCGASATASDGRTYWSVGPAAATAAPRSPRIDLVQCYDETIISYSESRDVLRTDEVSFPVPGSSDGFSHVILRDGGLLGHWRAARGKPVEVRMVGTLGDRDKVALERAVERYARFDAS